MLGDAPRLAGECLEPLGRAALHRSRAYGYEATGERSYWLVFYPLFPWLTRLVSPFGDYILGAFIVSTIASLSRRRSC